MVVFDLMPVEHDDETAVHLHHAVENLAHGVAG
nr:hypothetical protein BJQ95_00669 [Cryobacterium sp. SO1]